MAATENAYSAEWSRVDPFCNLEWQLFDVVVTGMDRIAPLKRKHILDLSFKLLNVYMLHHVAEFCMIILDFAKADSIGQIRQAQQHYSTLGISHTAAPEEVRRAYRIMAAMANVILEYFKIFKNVSMGSFVLQYHTVKKHQSITLQGLPGCRVTYGLSASILLFGPGTLALRYHPAAQQSFIMHCRHSGLSYSVDVIRTYEARKLQLSHVPSGWQGWFNIVQHV